MRRQRAKAWLGLFVRHWVPLALAASGSLAQAAGSDAALLEKGRQLAVAADCAACHTVPKSGATFAGGYAIESPMGKIYSTNITPSKSHGIGNYTLEDFTRALRQGVRKDGAHLYPAMPYTAYTQLADDDIAALYAFFMEGVKPVDQATPATELPFPFNIRTSMGVWNALFLKDERFKPDASQSMDWNRGAYLSNALAHCSSCHSPRNTLLAEQSSRFLAGGSLGAWYAPNITADANSGIGGWSEAELVAYLKTGHVPGKAQAAGPMAEAIEHSLQYLPDSDLRAIAVYLKTVPAQAGDETTPRYAHGQASTKPEAELRGLSTGVDAGWRVFSGSCAHCHQAGAAGTANGEYPSLFHNTATGAGHADNLIATILHGVDRTVNGRHHFMPAFGDVASYADKLSDQEIADVSNFVLTQYGNPAVHVSANEVRELRAGGKPPLVVRARPLLLPAAAVLIAIVVLVLRARRKSAAKKEF
ncbi:MAG: cytochrome C [Roseateles depolymerans]|uniref:Cytochrome C n=1 Tax=Roseateles depolymerans TaxID=76731 RepID=A0A2W5DZ27_9BURK|nr:MAG: cytochrome C [Roseateles depolymerans]